ncbi:MAG: hypothetical protein RL722_1925, partial [Pseudomonadota bacterium]
RTAAGGGQIEAFAGSTVDATVTVVDGPTVPVGAGRIADPVTLDHATVTAADTTAPTGINSAAVIVADASAVPPIVTVTASDTATLTTAGTAAFKPSSLNLELVDFVDIAQADFDPATNTLVVSASSGDKRSNPALTVRGLGRIDGTSSLLSLTTAAPPAVVHVDSAAGGTASAQVRVIAAVAPAAPSAPLAGVATSHTVTLSWTDNSGNETGFRIYTVDGAGIRTLRGTAGVNATSGTATGLDANTTYNFVIESYNGVGAASSTEVSGSTLALPATPANASFVPSTSVQNRLDVSWDVVADATEYQVYRGTNGVYPATPTATVTTNSYVDLGRAANTTYSYQVVARRTISGITDSSAPATSNTLTTVSAPTSALIGTASFNATTNVATVNWTDRSNATNNGEWGFQVYRRTGTTGNFAPVGPLQDPSTPVAPATTVSRNYSDTTLTASGTYQYRVDVSNWAGTLSSGTVNLTASIVNLNAPTNLSTVVNSRPTVNWTDNSSGETGHRLLRRQQTVNATTGLVTENTAAPTIRNVGANIQTYREPSALPNNQLLRYEVQAYNGGTAALPTNVGASGSAYVMTTGLPAVSGLALTSPNGAGTIRLTWTASTVATVGGYEVQRCEGATCTNFQKVTGTAVNTAGTVDGRSNRTFDDTGLTSGTTYRYRVRTVGGAGTTYVGATFSATVNRVAP